jgi:hypothetical protein
MRRTLHRRLADLHIAQRRPAFGDERDGADDRIRRSLPPARAITMARRSAENDGSHWPRRDGSQSAGPARMVLRHRDVARPRYSRPTGLPRWPRRCTPRLRGAQQLFTTRFVKLPNHSTTARLRRSSQVVANGAPGIGSPSEVAPRSSWPSHSGSSSRRSTGQHR